MKRAKLLILCLAFMLVFVAGCGRQTPTVVPPTAGESGSESVSPQRYVILVFLAGNEFWNPVKAGADDVVKGLGLNAIVEGPLGPTEWNPEQQLTTLDQIIATRPDGIIITAADSKVLVPGIERAKNAGIVVQAFDLKPETDVHFVGTDFREMGIVMGLRTVELCQQDIAEKGTCEIGITEKAGLEVTALRKEGLISVLKDHPEIVIAAEVDDQSLPEVTVTVTGQMLAANPNIRVLLGFHGQGAVAMATAVKNAGLTPGQDVYVIGNDLGTTTLDCIESGECDGTVGQDPYTMGAYSMINAYMQVNKVMEHTLFEGKFGVPWINPGTSYIQKDDLAALKANVEEIQSMFR